MKVIAFGTYAFNQENKKQKTKKKRKCGLTCLNINVTPDERGRPMSAKKPTAGAAQNDLHKGKVRSAHISTLSHPCFSILFSLLLFHPLTTLKRAKTHDDSGQRTRYYADDDVDLQTLVEREVSTHQLPTPSFLLSPSLYLFYFILFYFVLILSHYRNARELKISTMHSRRRSLEAKPGKQMYVIQKKRGK